MLAGQWAAGNGSRAEALGAGFTHASAARSAGQSAGAVGFAAGGVLDVMAPGPVLAGFASDTFESGLGRLVR